MAISRLSCPHCGRPSLFPNVDLANAQNEKNKLTVRYKAALISCDTRGTGKVVREFENACKDSKAVFALGVHKLHREIASGCDIFETYYDLEKLKNRTTDNSRPHDSLGWLGSASIIRQAWDLSLIGPSKTAKLQRIGYQFIPLGPNPMSRSSGSESKSFPPQVLTCKLLIDGYNLMYAIGYAQAADTRQIGRAHV